MASARSEFAVTARGLARRFGAVRAIEGVDLEVAAGEILVVEGPRGSGKTTLIRLLGGLLRAHAGEVKLLGRRVEAGEPAVQREVGILPDFLPLFAPLTVRENVERLAALRGLPASRAIARMGELAADLYLLDDLDRPVRALEPGPARRAGLLSALVHEPPALLLDEPCLGTAAAERGGLLRCLERARAAGAALLVTTAEPELDAAVGGTLVRLDKGRLR
jgi:ABC-2 type transport system ATP-binding protein